MTTRLLRGILSMVYPKLCLACGKDTIPDQEVLCLSCLYQLPKTSQHLHQDNQFTDRFWGRIPIASGAAFLNFAKDSSTQKLMHRLKYLGYWQIGVELGKMYGKLLKNAPLFHSIDYIIPIPLHSKRLKKRGYNQSEVFAKGLAEELSIPYITNGLVRTVETNTQTSKSRMERFSNVEHAFTVGDEVMLRGKHVLLVDDILTTGATMEAAGLQLLNIKDLKLSMSCIAMATHI